MNRDIHVFQGHWIKKYLAQHRIFVDVLWAFFMALLMMPLTYSFLSIMNSPLHSHDGAIYYMVGKMWWSGDAIPYLNLFDHKGPLLFLINAVAYGINAVWGLAATEFFCFFLTFFILEQSFHFFHNGIGRRVLLIFPIFYKVIIMTTPYQGGNFPEQYALIFIAYGIFCMAKLCFYRTLSLWQTFGLGGAVMACFLLKANLIYLFPVPLSVLFYFNIKSLKKTLINSGLLCAGALSVALPFLLYFLYQGAFREYLYANFTYNFLYASQIGNQSIFYRFYLIAIRLFWYPVNGIPLLLLGSYLLFPYLPRIPERNFAVMLLCAFILCCFAVYAHGTFHAYNAVVELPISVAAAFILIIQCRKCREIIGAFVFCCFFFIANLEISSVRDFRYNSFDLKNVRYPYSKIIQKKINANDGKILILALDAYNYYTYHAKPSFRIFYVPFLPQRLENELSEELCHGTQKLVYIPKGADSVYKKYADCMSSIGYKQIKIQEGILYER